MALCGVAYTMLLVGLRTKLAQVTSLVCVVSLHTRTSFVNNGGDVVLGELALLTAFLPTGRRYSLDALLSRGSASTEPEKEPTIAAARAPVFSLAVLVLTLQFAAIYLFNALNKTGPTWREGSVVHYMLHQDGIVTALGHWARGVIGLRESRVLTYASWSIELVVPVLLLVPFARRFARRLAVVLVLLLHSGFALFMNLGVFVPAMVAFAVNFIPTEDWNALESFWARRSRVKASVLALADRLRDWARPLAPRETTVGSVVATRRRSRVVLLREITVGLLGCLLGVQALFENPAVTRVPADLHPRALHAAVSYLQALQAWGMYAPNVPITDTNIYVDAITTDGRHVDPFNEVATPNHPHPGASIPPRLGQNNLFCAYALRIPWMPNYHQAFGEWIMRHSERTGREKDRIVSFEAFYVEDDSPRPGARVPSNARTKRFMKFPE
jgi:hypothetical protein